MLNKKMTDKFFVSILLLFLLQASPLLAGNISIDEIRKEYPLAMQDKAVCIKWFDAFNNQVNTLDPILQAYKGGIYMGMAKFAVITKKVSYVNKGKTLIEEAILNDKNNIEIRFIRFSIQVKLPQVLGYNKSTEEDKKFIISNIAMIKNDKFRNDILRFLKENTAQ